jgi:iron-sulfur cluster insertion protein
MHIEPSTQADATVPTDGTGGQGAAIRISASAARRIAHLIGAEGRPDARLRVSVSGGGCSGFQYGFDLDDGTLGDDDRVFCRDGAEVVVDAVSLQLVGGSELDYVEELIGAYFALKNPNASSTCGCGSSFSI